MRRNVSSTLQEDDPNIDTIPKCKYNINKSVNMLMLGTFTHGYLEGINMKTL
jgi:hypothetical protein